MQMQNVNKILQAQATLTGQTSLGRRALNVEVSAGQLDEATHNVMDAVNAIEDALQPLLGPVHPENVAGEAKQRMAGESEVAERILSRVDQLQNSAARIRDLINRL